jgi:hypothetical protein
MAKNMAGGISDCGRSPQAGVILEDGKWKIWSLPQGPESFFTPKG